METCTTLSLARKQETVSEHVNVVYLSLYKTLVSIKKPLSEKRDEGYSGVTIVYY